MHLTMLVAQAPTSASTSHLPPPTLPASPDLEASLRHRRPTPAAHKATSVTSDLPPTCSTALARYSTHPGSSACQMRCGVWLASACGMRAAWRTVDERSAVWQPCAPTPGPRTAPKANTRALLVSSEAPQSRARAHLTMAEPHQLHTDTMVYCEYELPVVVSGIAPLECAELTPGLHHHVELNASTVGAIPASPVERVWRDCCELTNTWDCSDSRTGMFPKAGLAELLW